MGFVLVLFFLVWGIPGSRNMVFNFKPIINRVGQNFLLSSSFLPDTGQIEHLPFYQYLISCPV